MEYPEAILPQPQFRKVIAATLTGCTLCRALPRKLSEEELFLLSLEELCPRGYSEFFGYSLNLPQPDRFRPEYCCIELVGEDKKRFYDYWTPEKAAQKPVWGENFTFIPEKGWAFLPYDDLHGKVSIPKPRTAQEAVCLYIRHAPTCCNYWHFEFSWSEADGKSISPNKSKWKEEIAATMRSVVLQNLTLNSPENPALDPAVFGE